MQLYFNKKKLEKRAGRNACISNLLRFYVIKSINPVLNCSTFSYYVFKDLLHKKLM